MANGGKSDLLVFLLAIDILEPFLKKSE